MVARYSFFVIPTGMTAHMNGATAMQIVVTFIATTQERDMTPGTSAVTALIAVSCERGIPPFSPPTTLVYVVMMGLGLGMPLCLICCSLVLAMNYPPSITVMPMNVIVSAREGALDREVYLGGAGGGLV